MKKWLRIAICIVAIFAIISVAVNRPPSLESSARRSWKQSSIAEIAARIADPSWLTNEFACLDAENESSDASWLSDRIIVTRSGEWLAYANVCQKQDRRIPDLFIAHGSDGKWYYSTYHFCIRMIVLRMDEQPEDLTAFTRTYFVQPFDGKSDDCLRRTWPPSSR